MDNENLEQPVVHRRISRKVLIVGLTGFVLIAGGAGYLYKVSHGGVKADELLTEGVATTASIIVKTDKDLYRSGDAVTITVTNNTTKARLIDPAKLDLSVQIRQSAGASRTVYVSPKEIIDKVTTLAPHGQSGDSMTYKWDMKANKSYNTKTKKYDDVNPPVALTAGSYKVYVPAYSAATPTFTARTETATAPDPEILKQSNLVGYYANNDAFVYYLKKDAKGNRQIFQHDILGNSDTQVTSISKYKNGSNVDVNLTNGGYCRIAYSKKSGMIAATISQSTCDNAFEVQILTASNKLINLISDVYNDNDMLRWSPDGQYLAYRSSRSFNVYRVYRRVKGDIVTLDSDRIYNDEFAWSTDTNGKTIALMAGHTILAPNNQNYYVPFFEYDPSQDQPTGKPNGLDLDPETTSGWPEQTFYSYPIQFRPLLKMSLTSELNSIVTYNVSQQQGYLMMAHKNGSPLILAQNYANSYYIALVGATFTDQVGSSGESRNWIYYTPLEDHIIRRVKSNGADTSDVFTGQAGETIIPLGWASDYNHLLYYSIQEVGDNYQYSLAIRDLAATDAAKATVMKVATEPLF